MSKKKQWTFLAILILASSQILTAQEKDTTGIRKIRLIQDDAQSYMTSKVYKLKYVKATDIRPFVLNAVKRYSSQSLVERVNFVAKKENYLIVSTAPAMIPYIDDMIAKLDKKGVKDKYGSIIEGTGVTRVSYTPRYRVAQDIINIINSALRTNTGCAFLNEETNTIYWKDDSGSAQATLDWVRRLDRPVPQVNLQLKYYEVRESDLKDLGLDYLAWKNGPGLDLFTAGFHSGKIISEESILQLLNGARQFTDIVKNFSGSWGYGGFYTAPAFDLSFIRILQQSGNAKIISHADLTFINTPVYGDERDVKRSYFAELTPQYQNITKDDNDITNVEGKILSSPALALKITDPVICFGAGTGEVTPLGDIPENKNFYYNNRTGGVLFDYELGVNAVLERNNKGEEVGNFVKIKAATTLGFGNEKLLGTYTKEQDVEQTVGIPFLVKIPILKYLFGTTTTIKEKTFLFVTAEANLVHPRLLPVPPVSKEIIATEMN